MQASPEPGRPAFCFIGCTPGDDQGDRVSPVSTSPTSHFRYTSSNRFEERILLLQDKASVATGGARGIGLATALTLSEQGSNIVLTDLDSAALEHAAAILGRAL
jgi:hypothetical protein